MEELRGGSKGHSSSTGRPTESSILDQWGLSETDPLSKEYTWAGTGPPVLAYVQLCLQVFMWVPQQLEQGLSLKLLPACGII